MHESARKFAECKKFQIQTDGRMHHLVAFKIRAGWNKLKELSGMLFERVLHQKNERQKH